MYGRRCIIPWYIKHGNWMKYFDQKVARDDRAKLTAALVGFDVLGYL